MYLNVIVLIDLVVDNMFSIFLEIDKFEDKIVLLVNVLNLFVSLIIMLDDYDKFFNLNLLYNIVYLNEKEYFKLNLLIKLYNC